MSPGGRRGNPERTWSRSGSGRRKRRPGRRPFAPVRPAWPSTRSSPSRPRRGRNMSSSTDRERARDDAALVLDVDPQGEGREPLGRPAVVRSRRRPTSAGPRSGRPRALLRQGDGYPGVVHDPGLPGPSPSSRSGSGSTPGSSSSASARSSRRNVPSTPSAIDLSAPETCPPIEAGP